MTVETIAPAILVRVTRVDEEEYLVECSDLNSEDYEFRVTEVRIADLDIKPSIGDTVWIEAPGSCMVHFWEDNKVVTIEEM